MPRLCSRTLLTVLALAAIPASFAASDPVRFNIPPRDYAGEAGLLTPGDFNGDGILDLATADSLGNVSAILNDGKAKFSFQPPVTTNSFCEAIVAADFNGDGKLDVAVACIGPSRVWIVLGNGDGTFQAPSPMNGGPDSRSLAVGDLNGDGIADLAVGNFYTDEVWVLLGKGDGSFLPPSVLSYSGLHLYGVAIADLNRDGKLDLIAFPELFSDQGDAVVSLGLGDGGFAAPVSYPAGRASEQQVLADVNGDGILDLVLNGGSTINVLLGNGDGSFQPPIGSPVFLPNSLTVGDFNGDGIPDVATTTNEDTIDFYYGKGDGTFLQAATRLIAAGGGPPVAGRFRGSPNLDLIAPGNGISVYLGLGVGGFVEPAHYVAGLVVRAATADLNHDGKPDLIAEDGDAVAVLLGHGDGTFADAVYYPRVPDEAGDIDSLSVGDFNADGNPDVLVLHGVGNRETNSVLTVRLGDGAGGLGPPISSAAGTAVYALAVGDFNRDGITDVAVSGATNGGVNSIGILLGKRDGTFAPPAFYAFPGGTSSIVVGDWNGDGKLDIVAGSSSLAILLGNGDGTFQPPQNIGFSSDNVVSDILAGDLNADGKLDLVFEVDEEGTVALLGNGDGTFGPAIPSVSRGALADYYLQNSGFALADFDGDGFPDLASPSTTSNFGIYRGVGDGTFQTPSVFYGTELYALIPVIADWNGDGKPDVAIPAASGPIDIYLNQTP